MCDIGAWPTVMMMTAFLGAHRSRSSSRRREMRAVDTATLKLFKSALRKSLELNIVPYNISLARHLNSCKRPQQP